MIHHAERKIVFLSPLHYLGGQTLFYNTSNSGKRGRYHPKMGGRWKTNFLRGGQRWPWKKSSRQLLVDRRGWPSSVRRQIC